MSTVIVVLVVIVAVLYVVAKSANSIKKSGQKMKGQSRCVGCKSRLKAVSGNYATVCRKCGMRQPWA